MQDYSLILASASPRRRDILTSLGYRFTVQVAGVDESVPPGVAPRDAALTVACRKARAVAGAGLAPRAAVLAADTTVELAGVALGKPHDAADATAMLSALSGRTHTVHTGTALIVGERLFSGVATTAVTFRPLSEEEIRAYIASGEPMDKAGAYGIQGGGGRFVTHLEGDLDTVVGLSCRLLATLLREAGLTPLGE